MRIKVVHEHTGTCIKMTRLWQRSHRSYVEAMRVKLLVFHMNILSFLLDLRGVAIPVSQNWPLRSLLNISELKKCQNLSGSGMSIMADGSK